MDYQSPGFAASSVFQQQMMLDAAQRRQAMLDDITKRKADSEIELGHAALAEKRAEAAEKVREKERAETERDVAGMAPGDIPDADLIARAKTHHIPLRTEPVVPEQIPQQFGQAATDTTGAIRYLGSPQQSIEAAKQKKIDGIIGQIKDLDPTSPQFKQLAAQYEMVANKALPAAFLTGGKGTGSEAVMRQHPTTGEVQRLIDGQWAPWDHDVPTGAHWMTVPDHSASDAARAAAGANQLQTTKEHAYAELGKWATPIQGHLDAIRDLGITLNAKTPEADRLVAPLVIKATISGQGSGFRMTRAEIENVVGGRSKWEGLKAALQQWSTDPAQALSLTDSQRDDLRQLTRKIRDKATKLSREITDARHTIDDAGDAKSVNAARTSLQEKLASMDEDEGGTSTGGLPAVGSMFNGGKVTKVTPIH